MQILSFTTLFLLLFNSLLAQDPNFLLLGSITRNTQDHLIIEIDKRYINNTVEEYAVMPNSDNNYGAAMRIEIPQIITIKYGDKSCKIFVQPYDTLVMDFDGFSFPDNLTFGGNSSNSNYIWQRYTKKFPKDPVLFHYHNYRKGIYYYQIHQEADSLMRVMPPAKYVSYIEEETKKKQSFYDSFRKSLNKDMDSSFHDFMTAEIYYNKQFQLLSYGDIYGGRHLIQDTFFQFLDSALIQKDFYLGNPYYRDFLMAFVNFRLRGDKIRDKNPYINQYNYAKNELEGRTKYFTMARMLALAIKKNAPEDVLTIYEDFIKENPYYELDKLVLDPFQKSNQFLAGAKAPHFTLLDAAGKPVSLHQFRGKVVYLDFWATWCRPCMEKLKKMQPFEPLFKDKEVVFIHVSLDRSKEVWQQNIKNQKLEGIQLFFDNRSSIVQDYEIFSVPKFFLITQKGNFAYTPSSYNLAELSLAINRLLQNK